MEPDSRLTCAELLEHNYFDGFRERFEPELQALMSKYQDQHQTKSKKPKVGQCYSRRYSFFVWLQWLGNPSFTSDALLTFVAVKSHFLIQGNVIR